MTNEQGFLLNISTAIGALTSAKNNIEAMVGDVARSDATFIFLQIVSIEESLNGLSDAARKYLSDDTDEYFDIFFKNEN